MFGLLLHEWLMMLLKQCLRFREPSAKRMAEARMFILQPYPSATVDECLTIRNNH